MSDVSFTFISPPKPSKKQAGAGPTLLEAWKTAFSKHLSHRDQKRFAFIESKLDQLEPSKHQFDCIVSPTNSYGIMDGGFDLHLSMALSPGKDDKALTRLVQSAIKARYYGFAPPGTCTLVPDLPSNKFGCRILAVCPTMRHPADLTWHKDIVYNTMWSLLVELERWNDGQHDEGSRPARCKIGKVLMSGLGTGVGKISPELCAQQMALAVKHFSAARSEKGKKKWSAEEYPWWTDVLPLAKEVAGRIHSSLESSVTTSALEADCIASVQRFERDVGRSDRCGVADIRAPVSSVYDVIDLIQSRQPQPHPQSHMSDSRQPNVPGSYPQNEGETTFSILPHPAKSNNPADLNPPNAGADSGEGKNPLSAIFNAPGPFIPSQEMASNLDKPLSREELQARVSALNEND
ncbi:hypothetical protein AX17_004776 [Amanita inopinata Kibby_2008]|nr:hypothetical protein AX17_004776 [Amanita inopinata Kibby_2008]